MILLLACLAWADVAVPMPPPRMTPTERASALAPVESTPSWPLAVAVAGGALLVTAGAVAARRAR